MRAFAALDSRPCDFGAPLIAHGTTRSFLYRILIHKGIFSPCGAGFGTSYNDPYPIGLFPYKGSKREETKSFRASSGS
jgi:hypothetical protein